MNETKRHTHECECYYGTSLMGEVNAPYMLIVHTFGKPDDGDGYKVDAQWVIETPAGIATIYNYKDGVNHLGRKEGIPKTKLREWHIGGTTREVVPHIISALGL